MDGNSYLNEGSRSFYVHFRHEHKRIGEEIQGLRAEVHDPQFQVNSPKFVERLAALRDQVDRHFLEEEEGCFDEIVSRSPALASQARRLEDTHGKLLEQLDALIEDVRRNPRLDRIAAQFEAFGQAMADHEVEESALVRQGLQLVSDED